MSEIKELPLRILSRVKGLPFKRDSIGESASQVYLFENSVLKIQKTCLESDNEFNVMQWLSGKLPVPEVIEFEQKDGYNYLLMSRLLGEEAYFTLNGDNPENAVMALADGLKMFWSININDCPYISNLDFRLKTAQYNVDNRLVDTGDFNDDTLGENGFKDMDELLSFLKNNRPPEDFVFTHGDYCLPNIFTENTRAVGFIDLGKAGVADRWQDIALCIRSLRYNCGSASCSDKFETYKRLFYRELGIEENSEKLRYYILLDELF